MDSKPYEGGPGSLLDIIDDFCKVTSILTNIVREQEIMIEQAKIAEIVFENNCTEEKEQTMQELDKIERRIRRL